MPAANPVTQNGQVLVRKALPTHPSPAVRHQLQLQLATAAQQRKTNPGKGLFACPRGMTVRDPGRVTEARAFDAVFVWSFGR